MVELSTDTLVALQLRYPLANVRDQMLLYALWLEKNPARRPAKPLRGVENWLKKASPKAPMIEMGVLRWWNNDQDTLKMASRLGLEPKAGEEWGKLRDRIRKAILDADAARTLNAGFKVTYSNNGRAA